MDTNKFNHKNNNAISNMFRTIRNTDADDIGKFLMCISSIIAFIALAIKLSAIMSVVDVILICCGIIFVIGLFMAIFLW